jgi:hypothetical protein
MSRPTSLLLDKNVVRMILRGIQRRRLGLTLLEEQQASLRLYQAAKLAIGYAYVTEETYNLIFDKRNIALATGLSSNLRELKTGKYLRRWARRLRQQGFTREDARVLSNATFGVDIIAQRLGVDAMATLDTHMINNFNAHYEIINIRLHRMTMQLGLPYKNAALPWVASPDDILLSMLT